MGFILASISYDQISDFLIKVLAPVTAAAILGLFAILRKHLRKNYSEEQLIELLRNKYRERVKNHPSIKLMDNDKNLLPSGNPAIELLFTNPYTGFDTGFKIILERSWADNTHRHIELVGAGGMGKTVTMLSMDRVAAHKPAIYVQLNELNDAAGIVDPIKDYILNRVLDRNEKYYESLIALCGREWDNGPRVLLVLDGLNEITDSTKKRNILCNIEEWARMSGIQILCSSRDNLPGQLTNMPPFLKIDILPLPEDRIIPYLIKSEITPPDRASLSLLSNPLLLNLYTKTGALRKTIQETNIVLFKDSNTKGGIIWNYLQSELFRISNITRNNEYDAALCILVSEFIAPCMAYEMLGRGDHSSTEKWFRNDIIKSIDLLNQSILPERIENKYNILKDHFGEDCLSVDKVREALTVKMHLISFDGFVYKFMHQQFRDALAAIHMINVSSIYPENKLPDEWKDFIDSSVMDFVYDLATPDFFDRLWEQNRKCPSGDRATLLQFEIQSKLKDSDFSSLDFSGMDLSNVFLYPYESDHCLKLPPVANRIEGTKITTKTFSSPGDIGSSYCCPIFVHDNGIVLSASYRSVLVWDVKTSQLIRELSFDSCHSLIVSPDERLLYCISSFYVSIWAIDGPVDTWNHLKTIRGNGFTLIHGGKQIVFGAKDKNLHVWSVEGRVEEWREVRTLYLPQTKETDQFFYCMAASPDGRVLACSFNTKVTIWSISGDVKDWTLEKDIDTPVDSALVIRVTPDNKKLWMSFGNREQWVWNLEGDAKEWERLTTLHYFCDALDFMPDGKAVLMGFRGSIHQLTINGPVDRWDERILYNIFSREDNTVRHISISPNGRFMVSNTSFTTSLWKRNKGEWEYIRNLASSLKNNTIQYGFSSDSHLLVISQAITNMVWDLNDLEGGPRLLKTMRSFRPHVSSMSISSSGQMMICGFNDGTLRIWGIDKEVKQWKLLKVLNEHESSISAISISQDGRKVVSVTWDGEVMVWTIDGDIDNWGLIKSFNSFNHLLLGGDTLFNETLIDTSRKKEVIHSLVISDNDELIISGGSSCLRFISIHGHPDTWNIMREYDRPFMNESVGITSDGKYLICGSHGSGIVEILSKNSDSDDWQVVRTIDGEKSNRTLVALSSGNRRLAIMSNHHLGIWDIQGSPEEWSLIKEVGIPECTSFALSKDGTRVALFSDYRPETLFWDINGEEGCKKIDGLGIKITAGAFTLDGKKLIASVDDLLYVWDIDSNQVARIRILPMSLCGLDLSKSIIDSNDRQVLAWNGATI